MDASFETQEQFEKLKSWWQENGRYVLVLVIVLIILIVGWQGWRYYNLSKAKKSAQIFNTFHQNYSTDPKVLQTHADQLMKQDPNSVYTIWALFESAQASVQAKDFKSAEKALQSVLQSNVSYASSLKNVARLRLASVLLDEKQYDSALKVLDQNKDPAFTALTEELKGDIFTTWGKNAEAKAAYGVALKSTPINQPQERSIREYKQDALTSMLAQ